MSNIKLTTEKLPDEIAIMWHIDDVKEIAKDLTDDECRQVLQMVKRKHDATIGVSWDTLEIWAQEIRNNRKGVDLK